MNILKNINQLNKKKTKEFNKIINSKKKYSINFFKINKNKVMGLYHEDKLILAGDYNFYGIFQPNTKLWIWASSIPGIHVKQLKNIRKIKESDYLFENNNDIKMNFYYQLLTQDSIYITDEKMLMWINELILYLSDDIYYLNPTNSESNIQFLTFSSIKEKYV
jgi:hypothetical protein